MKTKNIILGLLSASMAFSFSGCNMFEPELDNTYGEERVIEDASYAVGLLMKAYAGLPTGYDFSEVATDDAVTNNKSSEYVKMVSGGWSSLYDPMSTWNSSYEAIAYLNKLLSLADVIEWSPDSEERDKLQHDKITGEAYALRAYYHFQLLMAHGGKSSSGSMLGVPYLTDMVDPENESTWNLVRPPYSQTVEDILHDLDLAIELLPEEYKNTNTDPTADRIQGVKFKNRIDSRIATALKARVALHAASPAYNGGEYDQELCKEAAKCAAQLIEKVGGIAEMTATRGSLADYLFYDANMDSRNVEILWRANYVTNYDLETQNFPPSLFGNGEVNPTQNFVDAFPMANGYPITDIANSQYDEDAPYAGRDPRLTDYVIYNGAKFKNVNINTSVDDPKDGLNVLTTSTRTGYYLKKLLREDVNLNPAAGRQHFRPLIRYTELFLIYAEAANEAYGPDNANTAGFSARQAIRAIRQRAGVGGTTETSDEYLNSLSNLRDIIRNERRIELSFEGFRFWDIRRGGNKLDETAKGIKYQGTLYELIDVENRVFAPYMQYGPIPSDQITKTRNLEQNAGW